MDQQLARRRALLLAALGFRAINWRYRPDPAGALEKYLDSWRGLGDVIVGMHAQGFDVELRQLGDHWRANFYATGMAHSVVYGSAWEPTPWRAVSKAAWQAINDLRMAA